MRLTTATPEPGNRRKRRNALDSIAVVAVAAAMVLIFRLDEMTGNAPVQHLYYIPIVITAIRFGLWPGIAASVAAILLYHLGGELRPLPYSETEIIKMVLFVGLGLVAAKLSDDRHRFRHLAMTDDLTGLHNLRSFEAHQTAMVQDARRTTRPLSMLVLDVDRLKLLNDRHGHLAGAEVVRTVGHIIGGRLPPRAVACRYGGDEFAVALPGLDAIAATSLAEELRSAVNAVAPSIAGKEWARGTLSISAGVGSLEAGAARQCSSVEQQGEDLFHLADQALYQAKSAGRNRIIAAQSREGRPCV